MCCGKGDDQPDPSAPRKEKLDKIDNVMGDRRCRDCFCCILFLLFWAGMVVVAVFAIISGDPRYIIYGTDYEGNLCGYNNALISTQAALNRTRNLSTKPLLYWPIPLNFTFGICVTGCPAANSIQLNETICKYPYQGAATYSDINNGDCFFSIQSTLVFYRCIVTGGPVNESLAALNFMNTPQQIFNQAIGTITEAWWVLGGCAVLAILSSFIFICFLRCCAGCMVWLSVLAVFAAAIALDFYLWFVAFGLDPSICYPSSGSYNSCKAAFQTFTTLDTNNTVLLVAACVLGAGIILFLLILCCMCSRIRLAIQIVKEASKAMADVPCIVCVPIPIVAVMVMFIGYWCIILVFLASSGSITFAAFGQSLYVANDNIRYVMLYHLFGGLWTFNWIIAIGYTVIAGAVGAWYFTYPDPVTGSKSAAGFPVARSLKNTFVYHLGSLAFGALIIAIVQFIRILLAIAERQIKSQGDNPTSRLLVCILRVFQCCLACFERFLAFLNKNAYIEIALFGYSFCTAAKTAFQLILRNILRMAAIDIVGDFLLFIGKLMVSASSALAALLVMRYYLVYLQLYVVVVAIAAIIGWGLSTLIFAVFSMTIDTILLCFLEDIERHGERDDVPGKQYYMSKELYSFVSDSEKRGKGGCCCC
eukprot:TRINITY_DN2428_c0_g1_i1.p1 TRINITY_DN2428_c0_g1~~TRINITY_DN2428_c0_g1_i1.p1  ORF type:complete len:647 (+),score=142.72 TRINITY_DN2428_c0_g1_i1:61-2001(+)